MCCCGRKDRGLRSSHVLYSIERGLLVISEFRNRKSVLCVYQGNTSSMGHLIHDAASRYADFFGYSLGGHTGEVTSSLTFSNIDRQNMWRRYKIQLPVESFILRKVWHDGRLRTWRTYFSCMEMLMRWLVLGLISAISTEQLTWQTGN